MSESSRLAELQREIVDLRVVSERQRSDLGMHTRRIGNQVDTGLRIAQLGSRVFSLTRTVYPYWSVIRLLRRRSARQLVRLGAGWIVSNKLLRGKRR